MVVEGQSTSVGWPSLIHEARGEQAMQDTGRADGGYLRERAEASVSSAAIRSDSSATSRSRRGKGARTLGAWLRSRPMVPKAALPVL